MVFCSRNGKGRGSSKGVPPCPSFTIHAAIFDELERQGAMNIDVARLTAAVFGAQAIIAAQPQGCRPGRAKFACFPADRGRRCRRGGYRG